MNNNSKSGVMEDTLELIIDSKSENESFARVAVAAFCTRLDPTLEEITDIKTAVSEAVTNCIIHGYDNKDGKIYMKMSLQDHLFRVEIEDKGIGIEDINKAMEPMYTTKEDEDRSGMGFCFMEAFMDEVHITSAEGRGTSVEMKKHLHLPAGE